MDNIECNNITIGKEVKIHPSAVIKCRESLVIGDYSVIGEGCVIDCNSFKCGKWLYMPGPVEIGRGGNTNADANVVIGDYVGIFERAIINPNSPVHIGDYTAIGLDTMVWTHGGWLDVMQGFPFSEGPVHIGKNVWLTSRSIVLPNVTIGDNVVIGIGSIINNDLPDGCMAAGVPCKVIRENVYPRELSIDEKSKLINNILDKWKDRLVGKIGDVHGLECTYIPHLNKIRLVEPCDDAFESVMVGSNEVVYDLNNRKIYGTSTPVSEDLRDYLRRRGVKIYTDKHFKSI